MTYHCRPSEILGIHDEWAAYQLDVAAYTAGQGELNRQQRAARKGKGGRGKKAADAEPMPTGLLQSLMSK